MACCHESSCSDAARSDALNSPKWRRALWIALFINAGFFVAEIVAGVAAGSASLQADALDFFGDATNYAISLGVAGMALAWRARAALAKGGTMIAFALWVLGNTAWHAFNGTLPRAEVMGVVGIAALIANGGVALMLYRFRSGDANMRAVWICSRNDALGNFAVMLAAIGVFGTGTGWPDVIVATIMGGLGLRGGWQIISHARRELRSKRAAPVGVAAGADL
jgi:Co/Zn/Cd efflux system component